MVEVLLRAFAFIFIIVLGYVLKRVGFFKPEDAQTVAKIAMNITLPAAVISSFAGFRRDNALFFLMAAGVGCNLLMLGFGYLISIKKSRDLRIFYMLSCPAYNVGSFTLPFVQNFLGPMGVVATCMFDTGNSLMCSGGNYAITSAATAGGDREAFDFKLFLKKLVTTVPFMTSVLMLIVAFAGLRIPQQVVTVTSVIGSANGFVVMLMIGLMFEINFSKDYLKEAALLLVIRYIFAVGLSAAFYFLTPFSLEIRQTMAIVAFAPVSSLAPAFAEKCGGKSAMISFVGSVSIVISMAIMTSLITVMHI